MRFVSFFRMSVFVLTLFLGLSVSNAVILHPGYEPDENFNKPNDAVVGQWGTNASCVVIAPYAVITTVHQGGGTNTPVVIDGQTYSIKNIEVSPDNPDIRIAQLNNANLTNYVAIYTKTDENNKNIVLGGYGKGRGDGLESGNGYYWADEANTTLRWGTNKIDGAGKLINNDDTELLLTYFDAPTPIGRRTDYEAAVAEYDSGSGWFILDGGQWYLAGITYATENFGESQFGDYNLAHRLSDTNINAWISTTLETIPEPATVFIFTLGGYLVLHRKNR